jgi:hypothetical protein
MALVIRSALAFGIVLGLTTSAGWGQIPTPPNGWFRASWQPRPGDLSSTIQGNVYNSSPYRVTDVRLQVEGIDGENHPVGALFACAIGDIPPGGETSYVADTIPGAVAYRVTVVSYGLVSQFQAP